MLDDSGRVFESRSEVRKRRRKRVQKRTPTPGDFWESGRTEISHHSLKRLRRYRVRRFVWFIQVFCCLSVGLCIPYLAKWGFDRFVFKDDKLVLKSIQIETTGSLSDAVIAEAAGVKPGESLLRIDLRDVETKLKALPVLEDAKVTRQKPDTLVIQVRERSAVAWLSCPDHEIKPLRDNGLLLDHSGLVFLCREMNDALTVLPTIEVTGIPRPVAGSRLNMLPLVKPLQLIEASRNRFSGRGMDIVDVRALGSWGLLCRYKDELLVTFDPDRIEEGLADLDLIIKHSEKARLSLATINLVTVKNIPVTFHSETVPKKW
ncbi:MAG: FtsQ-type POTRA domain-containing protein [Verrucomicrobiales bacterium]|nr:FtsQ-type POTRA domain-containing protein [Verrucomicrobiales bacterium]